MKTITTEFSTGGTQHKEIVRIVPAEKSSHNIEIDKQGTTDGEVTKKTFSIEKIHHKGKVAIHIDNGFFILNKHEVELIKQHIFN